MPVGSYHKAADEEARRGLLRSLVGRATANPNIEVMVPSLWCCMDNAAMIALVGSRMYDLNKFTTLDIGANPDFDIEDFNND